MSFIINRWVRGDDFYGRDELLGAIRERGAKPTWLLGNRRVGKTSLLRQIEWLCRRGVWRGFMAMYWDLQGAGTAEGLKDAFLESLEDSEGVLDCLGLEIDALENSGFPEMMSKFRRKVKALGGATFLLLVDECEELVDVAKRDPQVLSTFRKLTHARSLALIMAGSQRMMDLDESAARTSPFLPDFLPPEPIGPFSRGTALKLLADQGAAPANAARIYDLTFGNPHLVQVFGEHASRTGSVEAALADLRRDRVCHYFFKSNFQCLPESMRGWLQSGEALAQLARLKPGDAAYEHAVHASLIRRLDGGGVEVSPLLRMTVTGDLPEPSETAPPAAVAPQAPPAEPQPSVSAAPAAPAAQSGQTEETAAALALIAALADRKAWLSALEPEILASPEPASLTASAANPPALHLMASLDEPPERIHGVLDGASPEYALGGEADERTAVFLAGLWLFRRFFEGSPFAEVDDPWQRAGAIGDRDPPIRLEDAAHPLSAKVAMVVMRCLKADPNQRYKSLAKLEEDLRASAS